jgi:hypothetical protein
MLSLDSVRLTESIQCKLNQPANITIKSCATMADHQPSLLIKTFSIYCLKKSTKNLAKCGLLIILLNLQPAFLHCTGQLKGLPFCSTLGSTKDLGITYTGTRGWVHSMTRHWEREGDKTP